MKTGITGELDSGRFLVAFTVICGAIWEGGDGKSFGVCVWCGLPCPCEKRVLGPLSLCVLDILVSSSGIFSKKKKVVAAGR